MPEGVEAISAWIGAEAVLLATLFLLASSLEDRTKTPRAVVAMRIIGKVEYDDYL